MLGIRNFDRSNRVGYCNWQYQHCHRGASRLSLFPGDAHPLAMGAYSLDYSQSCGPKTGGRGVTMVSSRTLLVMLVCDFVAAENRRIERIAVNVDRSSITFYCSSNKQAKQAKDPSLSLSPSHCHCPSPCPNSPPQFYSEFWPEPI